MNTVIDQQNLEELNRRNKRFYRIIAVVLAIILAALAYVYFFLLPKGNGGVAVSKPAASGKIQFLFGVYGPGEGKYPMFKKPMSVATDKSGNMYVSDSGNRRVAVFDREGRFMFEFGQPKPSKSGSKAKWEPGTFYYPYGIDIDEQTGNIFVADMVNKRIQIFTSTGKFVDWFPKKEFGGTSVDIYPTDLAVADGKVYICNPYQVVIFDTKGKYITDFGMPGEKDGQFDRPNGIDAGDDGTIYVSDCNNLRIQAFTPEGKHKWTFGKKVDAVNNDGREFGLPRNLAVGPDDNIYVADAFHFNIKVFSPEGKKLAEMGRRGAAEGTFNYPNGIEVRNDKVIYVVDKSNNRVQAIELDGFVIDDSRS